MTKITNYYTLEENENNYKMKKLYQDELAKQIEEKQREKQKILQREREMDRLEEENYKIYLYFFNLIKHFLFEIV